MSESRLSRAGAALRHPVSQNALAMYAVQAVLTALPLVTLPWMARALGPSELGLILFTQSFSFVAGILVEYGFNLSATRQVARERDDPEALAATVARVQAAKLALIGLMTAVTLIAVAAVPQFRDDPRLAAFGWAMAVLTGLSPAWYFIGVERIRTLAAVDVSARVLIAVAIVALVTEPGQGLLVLWIWTLGSVVSLVTLSSLMYSRVALARPRRAGGRLALREGWPLFLSTASVSLYTSGTVFMLGLVTSSARLAMFAAAERVARVAVRAINPVSSAAYPRVSHLLGVGNTERAQRLSVLVLGAVTSIGVLTAVLLYAFAPPVVRLLFGDEFSEAAELVRVFALMIPCIALTSTVSGLWLLSRGLDKSVTVLTLAAAVSTLALTPVIGSLAGPHEIAWLLVGVEAALVVAFLRVIYVRGLAPTRSQILGR